MKFKPFSPKETLSILYALSPEIFENETPEYMYEILEHVNSDGLRKGVLGFRGCAKTTVITKGNTVVNDIFRIKHKSICLVSNNEDRCQEFLFDIKMLIEMMITQGFSISKGRIWSASSIEVIVVDKDSSGKRQEYICIVDTLSLGQSPRDKSKNFKRYDRVIIDDLESELGMFSVLSELGRSKTKQWLFAQLFPAVNPSCRITVLGALIHNRSIIAALLKAGSKKYKKDWDSLRIPIIIDGKSAWESRFPYEDILANKERYRQLECLDVFYREYLCEYANY